MEKNGRNTVFISKMDLIILVRKPYHMGPLACHRSVKCHDNLSSLSSHSNSHEDQVLIDKIYNHQTQSSNELQWLDLIIGYHLNGYPLGCQGTFTIEKSPFVSNTHADRWVCPLSTALHHKWPSLHPPIQSLRHRRTERPIDDGTGCPHDCHAQEYRGLHMRELKW